MAVRRVRHQAGAARHGPLTYQDITPEKVERALEQINEALEGTDANQKVKAKVRRVRKAWLEQLKKYESQGKILDGRNSYSKTDPDATFMRMKEERMRNGQLKPGYNPQFSTNRQFILNYTLHQCAGDTSTYPLHMEDFHSLYGRYPDYPSVMPDTEARRMTCTPSGMALKPS